MRPEFGAHQSLAGDRVGAVRQRSRSVLAGLVEDGSGCQADLRQAFADPHEAAVLGRLHAVVDLRVSRRLALLLGALGVELDVATGIRGQAVLHLFHVHDPRDPGHLAPPPPPVFQRRSRVRPRRGRTFVHPFLIFWPLTVALGQMAVNGMNGCC
ncbi:hypothetical protein ACFQ2B_40540 [Streptomyces stramineus]